MFHLIPNWSIESVKFKDMQSYYLTSDANYFRYLRLYKIPSDKLY